MCKLAFVVSITSMFVLVSGTLGAQPPDGPLAFYVVSQEKIAEGRPVDVPNTPRLGYIAGSPDLAVTNIQNVFRQKTADDAVMGDKDGKKTAVPNHAPAGLVVTLLPDDGKRFAALTRKSIGKRLLIMLGDRPLAAPRILSPIEHGSFVINFPDEADLQRTEDSLKALLPGKAGEPGGAANRSRPIVSETNRVSTAAESR